MKEGTKTELNKIDKLVKKVKKLNKRVKQLEKRESAKNKTF